MKTFSLTALSLAFSQTSNADFLQMQNDMAQLAMKAANETSVDGESPVNYSLFQEDMGKLNGYGCWCYFETDHGSGRGHPIDEIDHFCKTLHDGYSCIIIDSSDDTNNIDSECVPWAVPYNSAFGGGIMTRMDMDTIVRECEVQNPPGTCEAETCKVEGWFVQSYFIYGTSGGTINASHEHRNGFDSRDACPISTGVKSDKKCCGDQPLRFPYKTYDDSRQCCQGHTFNANLYVCCGDGSVRMNCDL